MLEIVLNWIILISGIVLLLLVSAGLGTLLGNLAAKGTRNVKNEALLERVERNKDKETTL